jgi:peptidoglycan/xylan/chitin deacetylase (PgdA/CDA1 family)
MDVEKQLGFRSSFNLVPERYRVSAGTRHMLTANGFEVGVHGLNHDGKLYRSRDIFQERAREINGYIEKWNVVGFRSPAVHHNLEWIHDLGIEYDSSTFDVDPFQPQADGVETLFPFWVSGNSAQEGYVELPYTLPQDFDLFILMREKNTAIWERKLDWIAEQGGMALMITHPDYMSFEEGRLGSEEFPAEYYSQFLKYVKAKYEGECWQALPREVAAFVRHHALSRSLGSEQAGKRRMLAGVAKRGCGLCQASCSLPEFGLRASKQASIISECAVERVAWRSPPETVVLQRNQVHVWRARLDQDILSVQKLRRFLSEDELTRAGRFHPVSFRMPP